MAPTLPALSPRHRQGSLLFQLTVIWALLCWSAHAQSKINPVANPWVLNYTSQAGPDGPWNAIIQLVDYPEQHVTFFPSLTRKSLFIQASACDTQNSVCELQRPGMWTQSGAHSLFNWVNTSITAPDWDTAAGPLMLQGSGVMTTDRIVLWSADRADGPYYLDGIAITMASDFTVTPSKPGTWYTMDVGLLSLWTGLDTFNWTTSNGSNVGYDRFLNRAYQTGNIPSVSYGLHVGSVWPPIPGSLVLGGYDRSRCISTPIVSDHDFLLAELSLEVTSGGWPFLNSPKLDSSHLLRSGVTSNNSLTVTPNPGVPYMYLPESTCSTIASFLPVTLDQKIGYYIWNTTDPAFKAIMSSPSALKFSFGTDSGIQNISVPFALLNLTLDYPLASTPTQYFPCSLYTPSDNSAYPLGRAFLQAVFLGQNGQTQKTFLAQAPGPGMRVESVMTLASTDTGLTAMANPPYWNATWTDYLKALSDNEAPSAADTSGAGGLSAGAIAGIVVGVVGGLGLCAIAAFIWYRRRKSDKRQTVHWGGHRNVQEKGDFLGGVPGTVSESASEPIHEMASGGLRKSNKPELPAEMEVPGYVGELEASDVYRRSVVMS